MMLASSMKRLCKCLILTLVLEFVFYRNLFDTFVRNNDGAGLARLVEEYTSHEEFTHFLKLVFIFLLSSGKELRELLS